MSDSTAKSVDVHIGSRLRMFRTARKMSLSEIAKRIGMTYQQIQKYETGTNRVSASTLYRLAEILNVPIGEFFKGLDDSEHLDGEEVLPVDADVVRALTRIEDPTVSRRLRELFNLLADTQPSIGGGGLSDPDEEPAKT